jgi:hypothetical protein
MFKIFFVFLFIYSTYAETALQRLGIVDASRDRTRVAHYMPAQMVTMKAHSLEASDIVVNGGKFGVNYSRVATLPEREQLVKSLIRTVVIHRAPLSDFCALRDFSPQHMKHIAAVALAYMAAKIMHQDLAGNFYTLQDVLNNPSMQVLDELGANAGLKREYNALTVPQRQSILTEQFPRWYRDVCREKPDVSEQWAVVAGDIEASPSAAAQKKPYIHFTGYYTPDNKLIAVRKEEARDSGHASGVNRDFHRDVASYEIAKAAGLESVVRPILYYKGTRGEFTVEKFVAFMPEEARLKKLPGGSVEYSLAWATYIGHEKGEALICLAANSDDEHSFSHARLMSILMSEDSSTVRILFNNRVPNYLGNDANIVGLEEFLAFCFLTDQQDMHASNASLVADVMGVVRPVTYDCEDGLWAERGLVSRLPTWLTTYPKFLRQVITPAQAGKIQAIDKGKLETILKHRKLESVIPSLNQRLGWLKALFLSGSSLSTVAQGLYQKMDMSERSSDGFPDEFAFSMIEPNILNFSNICAYPTRGKCEIKRGDTYERQKAEAQEREIQELVHIEVDVENFLCDLTLEDQILTLERIAEVVKTYEEDCTGAVVSYKEKIQKNKEWMRNFSSTLYDDPEEDLIKAIQRNRETLRRDIKIDLRWEKLRGGAPKTSKEVSESPADKLAKLKSEMLSNPKIASFLKFA